MITFFTKSCRGEELIKTQTLICCLCRIFAAMKIYVQKETSWINKMCLFKKISVTLARCSIVWSIMLIC